MSRRALILVLAALWSGGAQADERCDAPLSDWRPREELQARLESQGWTTLRIRVDDGCYRVRGRDAAGEPVKARFDPVTLERVVRGARRHGGRHRDDDE